MHNNSSSWWTGTVCILLLGAVMSFASTAGPLTVRATYSFRLTKGKDVAVCEAYIQRLRTTKFELPPYCDRPEGSTVAGFGTLHRVTLSNDDLVRMWPHVKFFTQRQKQLDSVSTMSVADVKAEVTNSVAWTYDPMLDVDNDGVGDKILVWRGSGVGLQDGNGACGDDNVFRDVPGGLRVREVAFILTADGQRIDEDRTREVFGQLHTTPNPPGQHFLPIGERVGIFQFKGLYYIDAFADPSPSSPQDRSRIPASLRDSATVLLRQHGETREVCEVTTVQTPTR